MTSLVTLRDPSQDIQSTVDHSSVSLYGEYHNRADMARSVYACLTYLMREVEELNDTALTHCIRESLNAVGQIMGAEPDRRI